MDSISRGIILLLLPVFLLACNSQTSSKTDSSVVINEESPTISHERDEAIDVSAWDNCQDTGGVPKMMEATDGSLSQTCLYIPAVTGLR